MLIQFSVANFLSIKDLATFSMVAAKRTELIKSNIFDFEKFKFLKSAVILGANASGKSNFINAVLFAKKFIKKSAVTQIGDPIKVTSFKLSNLAEKPSYFEFIFINDGIRFRYGFSVDPISVKEEWLYYAPKGREANLFIRKNQDIEINIDFKEGKGLEQKTRNNALFLSVVAQFNGKISTSILNWFSQCNIISGHTDSGYLGYTIDQILKEEMKKKILDFLKVADLGIEDLYVTQTKSVISDLEKVPKAILAQIKEKGNPSRIEEIQTELKTLHKKYNDKKEVVGLESFELATEESEGTKKIFALAGPLIDTLINGKILFIDEFDSRLHPNLMQFIVRLFNSKENKKNAQLIVVSHNTTILNRRTFRRDQVWFVEKDKFGGSQLFSLIEYKVRKTASFDKDYLEGKYGATPIIDETVILGEK